MDRPRHPREEIESALGFAEVNGWRVTVGAPPAWGTLFSPCYREPLLYGRDCKIAIWSSPDHPELRAKALRRLVMAWAMADANASYPNMCRDHDAIHVYAPLSIGLPRKSPPGIDRADR